VKRNDPASLIKREERVVSIGVSSGRRKETACRGKIGLLLLSGKESLPWLPGRKRKRRV